jgi:NADH-quinone oxidoreductase subunit F
LQSYREELQNGRDVGTGCLAYGTQKLVDNFRKELQKRGLADQIDLRTSGCHGFCERGPMAVLHPQKIFYQQIGLTDAGEIIEKTLLKGEIIDRLLYVDPNTGEKVVYEHDCPFYKKQMRLIFGMNGQVDPKSIEDYVVIGGYEALAKALGKMQPEAIVQEVIKANLRGRGGGGFPAGLKWDAARKAKGDPKYVVCNADEGDPGAYMDRSLLEGNPHLVLEGMMIGAYAIGSSQGYIYVRNEYPLAVENVTIAIAKAKELGLLGENILGSGFTFKVKINRGGGAFVCGEETALLMSLEGKVGMPRSRPPYPAVKGLWDKPTNINNVETWANVPMIINKGAAAFASIGTEGSKGTKIFSLVGKINNTGLVEVPMGMTLREIIYDIGGGIPGGKKFKAVQTGGPSGGCIPEKILDLKVGFDELKAAGSMMGSGGMIVMDEDTCMVDVARYFLNFLVDESCGKCVPCREGVRRARQILTRITEGSGREEDIDVLQDLALTLQDGALCALGSSSANPVLSTLRYFRDEYMAHIKEKRCPARVCRALIRYGIEPESCKGCTRCIKACPQAAITGEVKKPHHLDEDKCIKCGACIEACKFGAIVKRSEGIQ